jgi:hypothetical protein
MLIKIKDHSCDDCGVAFGDYHSSCSYNNLCEILPGFLRGWKPRIKEESKIKLDI